MAETFWQDHNAWWKCAAQRMASGRAKAEDWDEANGRLWCLTRWVPGGHGLSVQDREDLVQTVALELQRPELLRRLTEVDAPAHYLATLMRNHLRNRRKRERAAPRVFRRHTELTATCEDQRPDRQVAWEEECAKARFVVNHLVSAQDRNLLWWFYRDELSAAEIGTRLGISAGAVLQRLVRARNRVLREFER